MRVIRLITALRYFLIFFITNKVLKKLALWLPKMARIMKSYGTPNQFVRNLVNMQYDNVVNMSLREQYGEEVDINLIFTGQFNG